jgi:hypothetical protein
MLFQDIFCKLDRIIVQPKAFIMGIGVCRVAIPNTVSHFVQSFSDNSLCLRARTGCSSYDPAPGSAARAQAHSDSAASPGEAPCGQHSSRWIIRLRPRTRPHAWVAVVPRSRLLFALLPSWSPTARVRPAMFSVGRSPVGGGKVGHWKWRKPSFSLPCWK